jgi:transposase InsO family protein
VGGEGLILGRGLHGLRLLGNRDRRGNDHQHCADQHPRCTHGRLPFETKLRVSHRPEFTARAVREWLDRVDVRTLFIEPGSRWENGYVESFNGKLEDELLHREILYSVAAVRVPRLQDEKIQRLAPSTPKR